MKRQVTRTYTRNIAHLLGVQRDIPAPDMGTDAQTMAWMMDAYSAIHGYTPGIVTGKPLTLGGSRGRREATGRGLSLVTRDALAALGMQPEGARVAIQGYGNVGAFAARFLQEMGCKIVAVADVWGGVHRPDGIDCRRLDAQVEESGSVMDLAGTWEIGRDEVLTYECDILVPAALGGVIHADNWEQVQARLVVEGANGPVTPYADHHLGERGVTVVPDLVANAGGVIVSYFEWAQNIQQYRWSAEQVDRELEATLCPAFATVRGEAADQGVSLRMAAFMLGVARVAEAIEARGFL